MFRHSGIAEVLIPMCVCVCVFFLQFLFTDMTIRQHLSGISICQGYMKTARICSHSQTRSSHCPFVPTWQLSRCHMGHFWSSYCTRNSVTLVLERNGKLLPLWWLPREVEGTSMEDDPMVLSWSPTSELLGIPILTYLQQRWRKSWGTGEFAHRQFCYGGQPFSVLCLNYPSNKMGQFMDSPNLVLTTLTPTIP